MRKRVWILFSVYKSFDDRQAENWATSVFDSRELPESRMRWLEDNRRDLGKFHLQENTIQTADDYPELKIS